MTRYVTHEGAKLIRIIVEDSMEWDGVGWDGVIEEFEKELV